ncbi:hypothetical protein ACP4OV_014623 [Aristida adscensionis]
MDMDLLLSGAVAAAGDTDLAALLVSRQYVRVRQALERDRRGMQRIATCETI